MKISENDQKNDFLGVILGNLFTSFSKFLPLDILFEDNLVIVFRHPKPVYKNHILIIPKGKIRDLKELSSSENNKYIHAIFNALNIATNRPEYSKGFKIISNYGIYQKVKQVHFHVYSD